MVDIGIDKIQLYNFGVRLIDIKHLNLMAKECDDINIISNNGTRGLKIEIYSKKYFSKLVIGQKRHSKGGGLYVNLTLSPSNVYGDNLKNMSWSAYDDLLPKILDYIKEIYRIWLDSSRIKVKTIEINGNITLKEKYEVYVRVARLLMSLLPIKCAPMQEVDSGSTLMRKNGSIAVSIYNKSKQIKRKKRKQAEEQSECDIMRIEIRLLNLQKVIEAFGDNCWSALSDEIITEYMCWYMSENMGAKYLKWHDEQEKKLIRMIVRKRRQHKSRWQDMLMLRVRNESERLGVPYILDVEQVCDALRKMPDPHGNRARTCKSLCKKKVDNDLYHNNDRAKAWEIMDAFSKPSDSNPI